MFLVLMIFNEDTWEDFYNKHWVNRDFKGYPYEDKC
jgi:hypothetical protein